MRRARTFALGLVAFTAAAIAGGAACTTFDGVELPDVDAAATDAPRPPTTHDATPPPPPPLFDAGVDSAPPYLAYLTMSDAAKACDLVFRCPQLGMSIVESLGVPVDSLNFASCMDWLGGPIPATRVGVAIQSASLQCVAAATSCVDAGACMALEEMAPNDPRCDAGSKDAGTLSERCIDDGGTVLRCGGQYALHCGSAYYAPGSKCMRGSDGSHWCATSTNCNSTSSCVGSLLQYCGGGSNLTEGINCSATGYTCGVDVEAGSPDCLTRNTNVACAAPGSDCEPDASVIAVCDGAEISEFDCAALDAGTCTKQGGGTARCLRPGDECSPFDATTNACNGTQISLCIGGKRASFDCASVGMTCKAGSGAQSGHCG